MVDGITSDFKNLLDLRLKQNFARQFNSNLKPILSLFTVMLTVGTRRPDTGRLPLQPTPATWIERGYRWFRFKRPKRGFSLMRQQFAALQVARAVEILSTCRTHAKLKL